MRCSFDHVVGKHINLNNCVDPYPTVELQQSNVEDPITFAKVFNYMLPILI
jgi:hypothetical protein